VYFGIGAVITISPLLLWLPLLISDFPHSAAVMQINSIRPMIVIVASGEQYFALECLLISLASSALIAFAFYCLTIWL